MKISDLNPEYDKLQQEYGAKELTSIYNGGRYLFCVYESNWKEYCI